MKTKFLLCLLLFALEGPAQVTLSGNSTTLVSSDNQSVRRAVVIGISDYQNKEISDLRFADRDAEAFAQYLRSEAGGNLDDDHLQLLINEQATTAQFAAALDWLIDESKEGDKAIIYFSGHGDVERKTRTQLGFLLTWDSPPKMYIAGAFPIFYLQEVVSTLSLENKAKVIIITDACRSGKLAGGKVNGSQLTSANLAKQFANEIKIMSCQPNEYSIEGEQWGGGRGVFSFHLVDGLYGMADKNTDLQVTLSEIDNYLENRVTLEVAPVSQIPMTIGLKSEQLAIVNENLLATIRSGKAGQITSLSKVESRGIEEEVLAQADSITRQQYNAWKSAIANKQFFVPAGVCADDLYKILAQEVSISRLHNHMKRNYAAALQDDAQQMLNDYLHATHKEIDMPVRIRIVRYARYIKQLEAAIKLLGPDHYMYNALMGRKLFIEGMHHQKSVSSGLISEDRPKRIHLFQQSLEYEPNAAYTYFFLAEQSNRDNTEEDIERTIAYCHKAMKLSPNWGKPYHTIANIYWVKGQTEKEAEMYKKALEVEPNSPYIQTRWAMFCERHRKWKEAENAFEKAIQLDSTYAFAYSRLGQLYIERDNWERASKLFQKALELDPDDPIVLAGIADYYVAIDSFEKAREALERYLEISPNPWVYTRMGSYYRREAKPRDYEKAKAYFNQSIAIDPTYPPAYYGMGQLYHYDLREFDKGMGYYLKTLSLDSTHIFAPLGLAQLYEIKKDYKTSVFILEKALKIRPGFHMYLRDLGRYYLKLGDKQKAMACLEKLIKGEPADILGDDYFRRIKFHVEDGQIEKADSLYHQLVERHLGYFVNIAKASFVLGKQAALEETISKYIEEAEKADDYFGIGRIYAFISDVDNAIRWLDIAFKEGYDYYLGIQLSADLDGIRDTPEFKALIKKYFPEQSKKKTP